MVSKLMGKKIGMMQRFDKEGNVVVCTLIEAEPNVVSQIKREESDGYNAVQIAFDLLDKEDPRVLKRRVGKPRFGHFAKAEIAPRRHLVEFRVDDPSQFELGQEIGVDLFDEGAFVDVVGTSKGKGFQGVMKLHGFKGGPGAHGSGFHRHAGSTGMRSTPGRCLQGGKRASQMGNRRKTVQNLRIASVDKERSVIMVCGAVPGHNGALVIISSAVKKLQT